MKIKLSRSGVHLSIDRSKERIVQKKINERADLFWLIFAAIIPLSIIAWLYYFSLGLTLAYNDARSHLNVSRRVFDSLQPGFAQIGSVWLPLQHILQLPLIMIKPLFRSGLSGSIISMLAFFLSSLFIWKTTRLLNLPPIAAAVAVLVFILNPNMLYMQTTPMTESLMTAMLLGTTYYFLSFVKTADHSTLLKAGTFSFLSVLTRYDGWFLFLWACVAIGIISLLRQGRKAAESHFILFATLGGFAIFLWFGWNALIFGDPLFFATSQYSAKAQQDILLREGQLLTKGNLSFSAYTYVLAVVANAGIIVTIMGTIGFIVGFVEQKSLSWKIALSVLLSPIVFNIISLYLGQSVIHLPQLPPFTYFNDRYGLMTLPSIAIGIAFLARKKVSVLLIIFLMMLQYTVMYIHQDIITINDARSGASGFFLDDIGAWLKTHAAGKRILVAASSHDALIFSSGLPQEQFVTEGAEKYWKGSLKDPTKFVQFVIMHDGDLVSNALKKNKRFTEHYKLVYKGHFSNVYKLQ